MFSSGGKMGAEMEPSFSRKSKLWDIQVPIPPLKGVKVLVDFFRA
jgi:hypothetical protein